MQPAMTSPSPRLAGTSAGAPLALIVAVAAVVMLAIVGGVWFLVSRGDQDPQARDSTAPTQSDSDGPPEQTQPTQPTQTSPVGSTTPGQSSNPVLHTGDRAASEAISFLRQRPTVWSDRKHFARVVQNSSGQYAVLQRAFDGHHDWYADIFVGTLGTAILYDGNVQAAAGDLALELRNTLYDPVPVTGRSVSSQAVTVSGHRGWMVVQEILARSTALQAPKLHLKVAVFDLGDGTAVAYVSDVPANRADLHADEQAAFRGLHIG